MTSILITADLHVGASHLTTLDEQKDTLSEIVEIARRELATTVAIAGDITHHAQPSTKVLDAVGQFFAALDLLGCDVVVVAGNHDPGLPSVAQHFRGRVHAITQPPRETLRLRGLDIAPLPYLPDSYLRAAGEGNVTKDEIARRLTAGAEAILRGYLMQRRPGIPLVAIGHGTIAGSVTSTGWSFGFIPGTEWIVDVATLEAFDLAAFGHIHRQANITAGVFIPGSMLPLDFAESETKRVIVAEFTGARDGARLPAIVTSFPLTTAPRVHTLDVPYQEVTLPVLVNDAANYVDRGDKYRVCMHVDEATAREYPPSRISEALYRAGASLVQVELDVERPDRARDASITSALTPMAALDRYLSGREHLDDEAISAKAALAIDLLRATDASTAGGDIALRAIEAENFISVGNARIDFDGHGVYALQGRNGSGKSTLGIEVLRYSLFGESRAGAKMADRLIRHGADVATAAVELAGSDGLQYRIVRKTKRGSRGPVTTLDVLRRLPNDDFQWTPLSTGKIASGEQEIAKILGDLSLDTLTAANLAPQRGADRFTRARPEERKSLLSQAAGLKAYDDLAETSRAQLVVSERTLDRHQTLAGSLRAQVEKARTLEAELVDARVKHQEAERLVPIAEEKAEAAAKALDVARDGAAEYDRIIAEHHRVDQSVVNLMADQAEWDRKKRVADEILADRAKYENAKVALAEARQRVILLEQDQDRERVQQQEHDNAERAVYDKRRQLERLRAERLRERAIIAARVDSAQAQERRLMASECPVIDRITSKALRACTFLRDARDDVATLDTLAAQLAVLEEAGEAETALIAEASQIVVPPAPMTMTREALVIARANVTRIEADVAVGEKIARAEEVVAQYVDAAARIARDRASLDAQKAALDVELKKQSPRPNVQIVAGVKMNADVQLARARKAERDLATIVASLEGQVQVLGAVREELARVERDITAAAADVAAWKELVTAWKACRVLVLESSVIPAVEDSANQILKFFPHGLQIAFTTQREKRDGAQAETLDIEVLGGKGELYEMCSGGEQTTIDTATHIAIALVVARRSAMRLRFLVADEPEGLDEPSRAAFAAVMRWLHQEHGLTVLTMSHMADLVDALGGQRLDVVAGPDGSTVVVA